MDSENENEAKMIRTSRPYFITTIEQNNVSPFTHLGLVKFTDSGGQMNATTFNILNMNTPIKKHQGSFLLMLFLNSERKMGVFLKGIVTSVIC